MMRTVTMTEQEAAPAGRLEELYRRHAPEAARLAYLLTGDRALAEDLVQDAFVRMFGRFRDLRNPDAFGAYLRRTVVNLANSHFRRLKVERAYLAREGAAQPAAAVPEAGGTQDDMWRALLRLPERQRTAIVLRYYEDLSDEQIADVLRCRPGTVKSLLSRGVASLRATVGDDDRVG